MDTYKNSTQLPKKFGAAFDEAVEKEVFDSQRCCTCAELCEWVESQSRMPGQAALKTACRIGYNAHSGGGCLIKYVKDPSRTEINQALFSCLNSLNYLAPEDWHKVDQGKLHNWLKRDAWNGAHGSFNVISRGQWRHPETARLFWESDASEPHRIGLLGDTSNFDSWWASLD